MAWLNPLTPIECTQEHGGRLAHLQCCSCIRTASRSVRWLALFDELLLEQTTSCNCLISLCQSLQNMSFDPENNTLLASVGGYSNAFNYACGMTKRKLFDTYSEYCNIRHTIS